MICKSGLPLQVRKTSQAALLVLLEQGLLEKCNHLKLVVRVVVYTLY